MTTCFAMPDGEQPNDWLYLLTQTLAESFGHKERKSAEDVVLHKNLPEDMDSADLSDIEEKSYMEHRLLAAALRGAYDALLDAGFDSDQAMEILTLKLERDMWGDGL